MIPSVAAPVVSVAPAAVTRMDDLGGILVVETFIDGKGPFKFVLDTGAGITVISPHLAKELNVTKSGGGALSGMGEKQVSFQQVDLASVSVGPATQTHVAAAVVPLPPDLTYQGSYGTIEGIIGYTFLKNYVVGLDVADSSASFAPAGTFSPPSGFQPMPITFAEGRIPVVTASVEGAAGKFDFDSGNNGNINLLERYANAHGIAKSYGAGVSSQYEGIGGSVVSRTVRLQTVTIGNYELRGVPAKISNPSAGALVDDHLDGNFGYAVLRQFNVVVDYQRARVYLQPSRYFNIFKPVVGTGVIPQRNADGTMRVVRIVEGSPAVRSSIRVGDTIVSIGDRRRIDERGGL